MSGMPSLEGQFLLYNMSCDSWCDLLAELIAKRGDQCCVLRSTNVCDGSQSSPKGGGEQG